ncbi:hypothetical protein Y032_0077g1096 [Ancylostoma ceylanicum]|uniref:SCP domain-containing protein n=1 Tax=Ancylostoma ceylanicum TaxID=53326 RepID=A0A016TU03_9BILA|nr:hypothetical protein Y032_0077g1096 [Ancylostoma ceylanicum]
MSRLKSPARKRLDQSCAGHSNTVPSINTRFIRRLDTVANSLDLKPYTMWPQMHCSEKSIFLVGVVQEFTVSDTNKLTSGHCKSTKEDGSKQDPMDLWLSEINSTSIDLHHHPEAYVQCRENITQLRNYCNLVRYEASRIGCAEKECDGNRTVLCLTNMP